ncbi:MAG: Hsp20/alpha crystallin family protein [Candidatus Bipolaricaulia bacterium]
MRADYIFSLQREIGLRGFFGQEREWLPPTDVYETEEEFIVLMELPGMEREEIKISFTEGVLTIRGERQEKARGSHVRYHQMEIRHGPFQREIYFPVPLRAEEIRAQYRRGLLRVVLPKR